MARSQRTQAVLAKAIDMKQQALSRRLSGQTSFTIDELGKIAVALDVPLAALVGEAVA
ncbi:hypothetical protein B1R94_02070 [Mycolicibacterium litorale]|nr:hypothetical protein B1R94_02070 [Mycolicibacterium litorale]